jgi:hypothetical protein
LYNLALPHLKPLRTMNTYSAVIHTVVREGHKLREDKSLNSELLIRAHTKILNSLLPTRSARDIENQLLDIVVETSKKTIWTFKYKFQSPEFYDTNRLVRFEVQPVTQYDGNYYMIGDLDRLQYPQCHELEPIIIM